MVTRFNHSLLPSNPLKPLNQEGKKERKKERNKPLLLLLPTTLPTLSNLLQPQISKPHIHYTRSPQTQLTPMPFSLRNITKQSFLQWTPLFPACFAIRQQQGEHGYKQSTTPPPQSNSPLLYICSDGVTRRKGTTRIREKLWVSSRKKEWNL